MGWFLNAKKHQCPLPKAEDFERKSLRPKTGDVWQCDFCMTRYELTVVDRMHDVMPGELSYLWSFKKVD